MALVVLADVDWPALVAAGGGVLVAIVSVVVTWASAAGQRKHERDLTAERHRHERDLARRERLYADVRTAYNLALAAMQRVERTIWAVHMRLERPVEPREAVVRLDEALPPETRAGVSTFGTDDVIEALNSARNAAAAFAQAAFNAADQTPEDRRTLADEEWHGFKNAMGQFASRVRAELREQEDDLRELDSAARRNRLDA